MTILSLSTQWYMIIRYVILVLITYPETVGYLSPRRTIRIYLCYLPDFLKMRAERRRIVMSVVESLMSDLLVRLGWSQVYFARRVGVSQKTVSRWCKGEGNLVARVYLEMVARVLGV